MQCEGIYALDRSNNHLAVPYVRGSECKEGSDPASYISVVRCVSKAERVEMPQKNKMLMKCVAVAVQWGLEESPQGEGYRAVGCRPGSIACLSVNLIVRQGEELSATAGIDHTVSLSPLDCLIALN
jgi:hypothetical protein